MLSKRFGYRNGIKSSVNKLKLFGYDNYRTRWDFGGDDEEQLQYQFKPDPYVTKTQDYMFPYASAILEGKPNPYYAAIGESGGSEFQKMLGLTNKNATNAANEALTRRGISRGGLGADIASKTVADATTNLSWADYNRAMQGRQWLMGTGANMMSGVRSAGLENQSLMNQIGLDVSKTNYNANLQRDLADQQMWSSIMSSGVGAIGSAYGMGMLKDMYNPASSVAPNSMTGSVGGFNDFSKDTNWMKDFYNS